VKKSAFYHTRGVPVGISAPPLVGKTRMVLLPDGEKFLKISLFALAQLTNVTDAQTDGRTPGDIIYHAYAYASRGKNWNIFITRDARY